MISFDTNILFFAYVEDRPEHRSAKSFLDGYTTATDVLLSEFVLVELYRLLRNPAVLKEPLSAKEAVGVVQIWRSHPHWQIAGFPSESGKVHEQLWKFAAGQNFAVRRIFDVRLALLLRQFGVTEFATANAKDFEGLGFKRVWNPLKRERSS